MNIGRLLLFYSFRFVSITTNKLQTGKENEKAWYRNMTWYPYHYHRSPAKEVLDYQLDNYFNLDDTLPSSSGYKCINYGNGSDTCRPCPLGTFSGIKEDCTACPAGNLLWYSSAPLCPTVACRTGRLAGKRAKRDTRARRATTSVKHETKKSACSHTTVYALLPASNDWHQRMRENDNN